ncbi:MAG: hypothetical protein ACI828_002236, partial [Flavobacteriales bacterium]
MFTAVDFLGSFEEHFEWRKLEIIAVTEEGSNGYNIKVFPQ